MTSAAATAAPVGGGAEQLRLEAEHRHLTAQHGGGIGVAGGVEQERDLVVAVEQRQLHRELARAFGAKARHLDERDLAGELEPLPHHRAVDRARIGERALADTRRRR